MYFITLIALITNVFAFPQAKWSEDFQSPTQEIKPGFLFPPRTLHTVLRVVQNPQAPQVVESSFDDKQPGIITADGIFLAKKSVQRDAIANGSIGFQHDSPQRTQSERQVLLSESQQNFNQPQQNVNQPQQNANQPQAFNLFGDFLNGLGKGIETAVGLIGFASPSLSINAKTTGEGGTAKTQIDSKTSLLGFNLDRKDALSGGIGGIEQQSDSQFGYLADTIAKYNTSNRLNVNGTAGQIGTDNCNEIDFLGNRIKDCSNRQAQINTKPFGQGLSGINSLLSLFGGR